MTADLREALRELGDGYPAVELAGDPWRRGRRTRRRRRAGVAAVLVAGVAAVTGGLVVLDSPDLSSAPASAGVRDGVLVLPDVPATVPELSTEPLGGPAAVVYGSPRVTDGFEGIPLVVGADDGAVRAVPDVGGVPEGKAVPSPDGTLLAMVPGVVLDSDDPLSLRVVDVRTGEGETYTWPGDEGLGGGFGEPVWLPDGRGLAVLGVVIADRDGDQVTTVEHPLTLDLATGQWTERTHPVPLAISPDGAREVRPGDEPADPSLVLADVDGPADVQIEASAVDGAAFSPDGRRLATLRSEASPTLEVFDTGTGELVATHALAGQGRAGMLGWGERGVLVSLRSAEPTRSWVGRVDPESGRSDVVIEAERDLDAWPVLVPADLVDADLAVR